MITRVLTLLQVKNILNYLNVTGDNKIIIRERLWYNKYRYRVEVYRNWRDTGFKEEMLKDAHDFINKVLILNKQKGEVNEL